MADENFIRASDLERQIRALGVGERAENRDVRDALGALSDLLRRGPRGGYSVSEVGQRARRIELSRLEESLRSLKQRSDELFRADASRAVLAGIRTPEQQIAYRNRLHELSTPKRSLEHERNVELYGDAGAADIEAREQQNRVDEAQARRRRERARGRHNAWYDNLSEKRQELFDLTMRYGGGDEGREAARHHIDRNRERERRINNLETLRKHPWMKPLMTAGIIQTRSLPRIAKTVEKLEKAPIFGKYVKHPAVYGIQAAVALVKKYLEYAGNTAKLGAESDVLGIPLSSLKSAGHVLSAWGGNEESYAKALAPYGGKLGKMMMGLGNTDFLLDDAIALGGDVLGSGAGGLMSMTERVGRYAERIREAYKSGDIEKGVALGQMAGFDTSMMAAAIRGEDLSKYTPFYNLKDKALDSRSKGEGWNRFKDDPLYESLTFLKENPYFLQDILGIPSPTHIFSLIRLLAAEDAKFDADKQYGEQPSATRDAKGTVIYLNKADFHGVQDVEGLKSALENEAGSNADYARAAESNVPKRW